MALLGEAHLPGIVAYSSEEEGQIVEEDEEKEGSATPNGLDENQLVEKLCILYSTLTTNLLALTLNYFIFLGVRRRRRSTKISINTSTSIERVRATKMT